MTKEELIQELNESAEAIEEYEGSYGYMFDAIADMVKDSDLVEVVRCKDCKKWKDPHDYECPYHTSGDPYIDDDPEENFFCAKGEKKIT